MQEGGRGDSSLSRCVEEEKMKKRLLAILLTGVMVLGLVSGCSTYTNADDQPVDDNVSNQSDSNQSDSNQSEGENQSVDTINVAAGVALTLNQFTSQASNDSDSLYLIMSALVRYYDNTIENDAAESYDISEDGSTYTFHLREGLKYSDGTDVTAEDFRTSFLKMLSPDSGSTGISYYTNILGADAYSRNEGSVEAVGIEAPDAQTLIFKLDGPDGTFIKKLALNPVYPVPATYLEEKGEEYGSSPETILCSGPYTLTEWTLDTSMSFEKNESWWNAANEFPMKKVNIMQIDSANTKVSTFQSGGVDIIGSVDPNYIPTIEDYVKKYQGSTEMFLWIKETGTSDEATRVLSNDHFRKAITLALDREAISSAVSKGFVGTNRAVSANFPTVSGDTFIKEYPIDVASVKGDQEQAKQYLTEALSELGYSDVSELPEMTYIGFERDDMKLLGEAIVDTWKQVLGITSIQFVQYPIPTAIQNFYQGNYDLFMISLGCSMSPDDIIKNFTSDGDYAFFTENWKTDITSLIEEAHSLEYESDAYYQKVADAEEALLNEYSFVPLYNQTFYYALAKGVEGYVEPSVAFQFQFNHLTYTK